MARASAPGVELVASLGPREWEACLGDRGLPDIRFGSTQAVYGFVWVDDGFRPRLAGAGEAVGELLDPTDSTRVGEAVPTLDDGSLHLWFPAEMGWPGCNWLVRVTLDGGASFTRPLLPPGQGCAPSLYHDFTFGTATSGASLVLEVADPAGDHTGRTDVRSMTMTVDAATGAYTIVLVADSAAPFVDSLRVNVNLYNPQAGSFFSDTMNDLVFGEPATKITLTGTSPSLLSWRPGQDVYTNSLDGAPNPPGSTLFRTSVTHFPMGFLDNEDVVAFEDLSTPAVLR
jgi:hypothetical protein